MSVISPVTPRVRRSVLVAATLTILALGTLAAGTARADAAFNDLIVLTANPDPVSVIEGNKGITTFTIRNNATFKMTIDTVDADGDTAGGDPSKYGAIFYNGFVDQTDAVTTSTAQNVPNALGDLAAGGGTSNFDVVFTTSPAHAASSKDNDIGFWNILPSVHFHRTSDPTMTGSAIGLVHVQVLDSATAVPEPPTVAPFAFIGLGILGVMLRAYKRKMPNPRIP
jgi:PEP-CTERM motif